MTEPHEIKPGQEVAIPPSAELEPGWETRYRSAAAYLGSLFDEYAPDVSHEDRLIGVTLGATELVQLESRYGPNEQMPRVYGGAVEAGVLATYHHAGHSYDFIQDMFRYAAAKNRVQPGTYDSAAFIRFPIIGAFHDSIKGNGRGEDERLSAQFATEMMTSLGFTLLPDEPTAEAIIGTEGSEEDPAHAAIISTTWNDEQKRQAVDLSGEFAEYQQAAGVADLMSLFDRRGPYKSVCLAIEDMCKVMNDRIFQHHAYREGFDYTSASVDECMQFVDTVPALGTKLGDILRSQVGFFANFQPVDPLLDSMFPGRADNIVFMRRLSELYDARLESDPPMTAHRCLLAARDFMASAA